MNVVITQEVDEARLRMLRSVLIQLLTPCETELAPSIVVDDGEDWSEAA